MKDRSENPWIPAAMRGNQVVDLRNLYEPAAMRAAGFRYQSIGRP